MAFRLAITEWQDSSSEYERGFVLDRVIIGRSRGCEVCLPDMAVSTRHAEIRLLGNEYAIVDQGSVNGTSVGGRPLIAHRPHKLRSGDVLSIAGFRLRFYTGAARPQEDRDAAVDQARSILQRVLSRSGHSAPPVLTIAAGPGRGTCFDLPEPPAILCVGRDRECAVRLLDDQDVSRRHAEVRVETDGVFLRDLGSRNGVQVHGQRVEAVRLEPGVCATVGRTALTLSHPTDQSLAAILDAPEEETSSFTLAEPEPGLAEAGSTATAPEEAPSEAEPAAALAPLPIGPDDPLLDPAGPRGPSRTTGALPVPSVMSPGSDLGLIIVGAILVIAAVIGLAFVFG